MERNEELRNEETERAAELREAQLRRSSRGDEGYTNSDSLVRDDSFVAGSTGIPADRTARASDQVVAGEIPHDSPTIGDQVGEAAGGIGGVLAGAAIGSLGGPIGTVIGGLAGAIGGWWTGRAISEAASNFSHADDEEFRADFETRDKLEPSTPNRSYDRVRPAYQLGHLASRNPEYSGRSFDDIEEHLERGWTGNAATQDSDWVDMRDYARTAYVRGAASQSSLTGDSGAKDSLSSTGTPGSVGTGSDALESDPVGTSRQSSAPTTSFANISPNSETRTPMNQSSANDDAAARLASPKGSSFTRQGDVPLNTSGSESDRGPSFTDPVAGEGVENIGSSGAAPRGSEGTLNEAPRSDKEKPHEY